MLKRIENEQTLLWCLKHFDSSFPVNLSDIVGDVVQYMYKLYLNAYNYLVEIDDKIAGFISFYANKPDTAYIALLAVDERYRQSGSGSILLQCAIDVARDNGMKKLRLETDK